MYILPRSLCCLLAVLLLMQCSSADSSFAARSSFGSVPSQAREGYDPDVVLLAGRSISTIDAEWYRSPVLSTKRSANSLIFGRMFVQLLVALRYPVQHEVKKKFESIVAQHNGFVLRFVPHHSFHVFGSPELPDALYIGLGDELRWLGLFSQEDKLTPDLSELFMQESEGAARHVPFSLLSARLVPLEARSAVVLYAWINSRPPLSLSRATMTNPTEGKIEVDCSSYRSNEPRLRCLRAAATWLSERSDIYHIFAKYPVKTLNKFALPVAWTGNIDSPPIGSSQQSSSFPLKGEGQIVGLSDTGLDLNSCFFFDTVQLNQETVLPNYAHRKVVMYLGIYNDTVDYPEGHGTHVAGTILGDCLTASISQFNGIASAARLAIVDIGAASLGVEIQPPSDLQGDIYGPVYSVGARIHAEAWGGPPESVYSDQSLSMDEFISENPDFLIVRGAGNSGTALTNDPLGRAASITSQASAKNVLSVGSSKLSFDSAYYDMPFRDYILDLQETFSANCLITPIPDWCSPPTTAAAFQEFCCHGPYPALIPLCCIPTVLSTLNSTYIQGVSDFSSRGPTMDLRIKPEVVFPGEWVMSARSTGLPFSGQMSATDINSALFVERGTSQATAVAAGFATIVREYFWKGLYQPPNQTTAPPGFSAPASLIKAAIINSAAPLLNGSILNDGYTDHNASASYQSPYNNTNFFEGYGQPSLERAIFLPNYSSGFTFFVPAMGYRPATDFIATGDTTYYCFRATTPGMFTATLVWTDAPGASGAFLQLVNDLNLVAFFLTPLNATSLFGNGNLQTFAKGGESPDYTNNVEKVSFAVGANQLISLWVNAVSVIQSSPYWAIDARGRSLQAFSLVVSGPPGLTLASGCAQCQPGTTNNNCYMPNGVGIQKCGGDATWQSCKPASCSSGYTTSSWTGKCQKLLSFTTLLCIASGVFIFLCAISCFPVNLYYVYVIRPKRAGQGPGAQPVAPRKPDYWDLFSILKPELWTVVVGSVLSLVGSSFSLVQPIIIAQLLADLPNATSFSNVSGPLIEIILVTMGEFVFSSVGDFIVQMANRALLRYLRNRLFAGIMSEAYWKLERLDRGELQNRIMMDTTFATSFPSSMLTTVASGLIRLVVGIAIAIFISWKLTVMFLAVVPLMAGIAWIYARVLLPLTSRQLTSLAELSTIAYDALLNLKTVKLYANENEEVRRFQESNRVYDRHSIKMQFFNALSNSGKLLLIQMATISVLFFGAYLVISFEITTYLLITFFLYAANAIGGVAAFTGLYTSYAQAVASVARLIEIGNLISKDGDALFEASASKRRSKKPSEQSYDLPKRTQAWKGQLEVVKLGFAYPNMPQGQFVFRDLTTKFVPGLLHAIIGSSGVGKTTLLNMLARLYPPVSGQILLDGIDVQTLSREQFLAGVSVVEQQPKLFSRTVFDNIAYSKLDATEAQVREVGRIVNLDDFIMKLPQQYQTKIGENSGIQLSGGQKQRMAIARALLRDPKIILMDEPTSDLDVENANRILDLVFTIARQKNVILITHNISSIERAGQIYFLQAGRLQEQGTHAQLVNAQVTADALFEHIAVAANTNEQGAYFRFLQLCFSFGGGGQVLSQAEASKRVRTMAKRATRITGLPNRPIGEQEPVGDALTPFNRTNAGTQPPPPQFNAQQQQQPYYDQQQQQQQQPYHDQQQQQPYYDQQQQQPYYDQQQQYDNQNAFDQSGNEQPASQQQHTPFDQQQQVQFAPSPTVGFVEPIDGSMQPPSLLPSPPVAASRVVQVKAKLGRSKPKAAAASAPNGEAGVNGKPGRPNRVPPEANANANAMWAPPAGASSSGMPAGGDEAPQFGREYQIPPDEQLDVFELPDISVGPAGARKHAAQENDDEAMSRALYGDASPATNPLFDAPADVDTAGMQLTTFTGLLPVRTPTMNPQAWNRAPTSLFTNRRPS